MEIKYFLSPIFVENVEILKENRAIEAQNDG